MRTRNWLLILGLPASMAWSLVVADSLPHWFDPSEDCAGTAGDAAEGGARVHTSWFPPSATCDFGDGRVYDYMSQTRTTVFTVIGVLVALVVAAGMVLWVRSLFRTGGAIRSPEAINLRQRKFAHLTSALAIGALGSGALTFLVLLSLLVGGPPGMISASLIGFVGLAAIASAVDRSVGPLPSTAGQPGRRGASAALLVVLSAAIAPKFPEPQLLSVAFSAGVYVLTVVVQWSLAGRPSIPESDDTPATADPTAERR
ncbi:hypothetical protein [Kribbella sp. ALI-6-A]|uniref:hypothetical protein n=1 Tax=Kribbella sp. ALI-6-A TaxID=1933817 RepID=UPI00117B0560|nr:hypothetical protein [Kribbella sp. ALI-6-A]